jgi:2-dehydro-3-deoxy-D-arabinonate dehydratase
VYLARHQTARDARWALHGKYFPTRPNLGLLLELSNEVPRQVHESIPGKGAADDPLLSPLEPIHEVWAGGVTYLRSEHARKAESGEGDLYARAYETERPELFLKPVGW